MEWFFAYVFEVVHGVGWYEYGVAFACGFFLSVAVNAAFAVEDEDFVFPIVRMVRRFGAGLQFEVAHGKVWCAVFFRDEPSNFDARFARIFVLNIGKVHSLKAHNCFHLERE